MTNSRTKNSARNATINLLARIVTLICGFAIRTVFLKYLGDEYTGISTLFTDILNILSFTELVVGTSISFAFYRPVAEKNDLRIAQLIKLCKYIYFTISIAIICFGLASIHFLDFFVKNVPDIKESITVIYILYVIKTSISYLLIYRATLLIAMQKQYVVTLIESVCNGVKTILEIAIIIVSRDFMSFLIIEIVFTLFSNILISIISKKNQGDVSKLGEITIQKDDVKKIFTDVKDIIIYKVNGIILNSTDSLIISNVLGTASVTFLSNYNLVFNAISNIAFQVISAMTASVGNMAVVNSGKEQKNVFFTINFICFCFSSVVATGLWLCINPFIEILWGEKYVLSNGIVLLLCANMFIVNMHMAVDMFRNANGIFHKGRLRPLVTAVINLVTSIVAVQFFGLFGVLLGTIVARLSTQMWYDSKLIFNLVFDSSVIEYYKKYFLYVLITVSCGALGSGILCLVGYSAIVNFSVGFVLAVLINAVVIMVIFHKSNDFVRTISYVKSIFRR